MFSSRAARAKRFSLLLLEEEEDYVQDWVVVAAWPLDCVEGNWQRSPALPGCLRLCTRSLFFEPDDVRTPIVRIPFSGLQSISSGPPLSSLLASAAASTSTSPGPPHAHAHARGAHHARASAGTPGGPSLVVSVASELVLMRANAEEVPYTFLRGEAAASRWAFAPQYSPLQPLVSQAGELLAIYRRPREERNAVLEDLARQRLERVGFDLSRLVDYGGERPLWVGPVVALTPLVRERGHLALTNSRVYFQPLHNIAGDCPVKSHPLAAIAAVARRRSSLRPIGLELFFVHPPPHSHLITYAQQGAQGGAGGGGGGLAGLVEVTGPFWDTPSAFFAFSSEQDREAARHLLTTQPELGRAVPRSRAPPAAPSAAAPPGTAPAPAPAAAAAGSSGGPGVNPLEANGLLLEAAGPWLRRVTAAWQRAAISNFDYLLYLNFAAGRSFNDLAQWPVFPWVLKNYVGHTLDLEDPANYRDLSKPVGALNPGRLEEFLRRFREMPTDSFEGSVPPFLYGTHYSTPGYVMYWLVRAAPSHMLRLQNGRFDAPDRLFGSVREAWEGVLTSSTDVKELIPEFYMAAWDFLVNAKRLPLGVRQNGRPVEDVELPPWAADPRDFLAKHRAALESPAVSRQLHAWIDLVFGHAQRGPAAEAAHNVFFHLTYEGAVDVEAVTSPVELKALETQINEFGQTPKQLFTTPHPPRLVCPPTPDPATVFPPADRPAGELGLAGGADGGAAGGGGGGGTGYGGDGQAGNRDLALALLSTIMAAASPELAAADGDGAAAAAAVTPGRRTPAGAAVAGVAAGEVAAARSATASPAPATPPPGGAAGVVSSAAAGVAAGAASLLSSFLKLGRYQSSPQHPAGAAAAGGALSAPPGQLSAPATAADTPFASTSAAAGDPVPPQPHAYGTHAHGHDAHLHLTGAQSEPSLPSSVPGDRPDSGPGGAASASLLRMSDGAALHLPTDPGGTSSSAQGTGGGEQGGRAGAGALGHGVLGGRWRRDWGWGARCSRPLACLGWAQLARGSLSAVASGRNGYLYCVGQGGVRVVTEPASLGGPADAGAGAAGGAAGGGFSMVRSAQLDGELLALALLPQPPSAASAAADADAADALPGGGGGGAGGRVRHPLLLAGSHNRRVYAYAPDVGRVVGSWDAHDDAVCCVVLAGAGNGGAGGGAAGGGCSLVTSSWDCSVKVWRLAEGRAPWSTGLSLPALELRDFDSGVWALAADPWGGPLLATGTEEGVVALWDTRASSHRTSSACAWRADVAGDYVGGLALVGGGAAGAGPGGAGGGAAPVMLVAATADGALSLYDIRGTGGGGGAGLCLASAACGAPLRCCAADGRLAVAGDESGALQLWDVGRMAGGVAAVRQGGPGPDGLYEAWAGEEVGGAAVSGLEVYPWAVEGGEAGPEGEGEGAGGGGGSWEEECWGAGSGVGVRVAMVTEEGRLVVVQPE